MNNYTYNTAIPRVFYLSHIVMVQQPCGWDDSHSAPLHSPHTGWLMGRQKDWFSDRLVILQRGWFDFREACDTADRIVILQTGL